MKQRTTSFSISEEMKVIRLLLNSIIHYARTEHVENQPKPEYPSEFAKLGKPPFLQKSVADYIFNVRKNYWTERSVSLSALRSKIQRALNQLRAEQPNIVSVFNFKGTQNSLSSPSPSRVSQSASLEQLQERVEALEVFQRRFEIMLQSGRPEPEMPRLNELKSID